MYLKENFRDPSNPLGLAQSMTCSCVKKSNTNVLQSAKLQILHI